MKPSSRRPPKLLCGTATRNSDVCSVAIDSADTVPDFWLYLSGIQPDVVDDTVRQMVQESLGTNEFKLVKLIPKGKDQRMLTFISFKVGIAADLKEKAMSADTWPMGIRFREFENQNLPRAGFWRPSAPVPENTLPQITVTSDHPLNVA